MQRRTESSMQRSGKRRIFDESMRVWGRLGWAWEKDTSVYVVETILILHELFY